MATRLLIFCLLSSVYSFAQYPSTTVGYINGAPAVVDTFGLRFMPSAFINAKGAVRTAVDAATGLYIKSNNSSDLPNIGINLSMGDSNNGTYGIYSIGSFNSTQDISWLWLSYENNETGSLYGSNFKVTGNDPIAFYGRSYTNTSDGESYGGIFSAGVKLPLTGVGTATGLSASGQARSAFGVNASAFGTAPNEGSAYGIFAKASGAATNYAGYFQGDVKVTGTFTNPSDARLKRNINKIGDALSKVMQLNPSHYEFKTDTYQGMNLAKGKHYGFLAQDMEKVFPSLVSESPMVVGSTKEFRKNTQMKGLRTTNEEATEATETLVTEPVKSVNYLEMIPILTKAIQEQQAMIQQQASMMKQQQAQIEDLKAEVKLLKGRK